MIDPSLLLVSREHVVSKLGLRNVAPVTVDMARNTIVRRNRVQILLEGLRSHVKRYSRAIASNAEIESMRAALLPLKRKVTKAEALLRTLDTLLGKQLHNLPNLPDDKTPLSNIITYKDTPPFKNLPTLAAHWDIGEELGISDARCAAKMSGNGFSILRGTGARLLRGLLAFGLDIHRSNYEEIILPKLVRPEAMVGSGHLPKFVEGSFSINSDGFWLIPTAEVPLVAVHSQQILEQRDLPIRYMTQTTCFRREVGGAGRASRGMQRLHEYEQLELFRICLPDRADIEFEELTIDAERALELLSLPYRVVDLSAVDLPFQASRARRLDVYAPGCDKWLGVSTISLCSDFQARRSNIRTRAGGRNEFVYTLNASAIAASRLWAAVIECGRMADGRIKLPSALTKYVDTEFLDRPITNK